MPTAATPTARTDRARGADPGDAPALRTLLAHAYLEDPLLRWVFADPSLRGEATAAWLGTFVDRYLPLGRARVVDRETAGLAPGPGLAAAAVWRWPTDDLRGSPVAPTLPTPAGVLAALVGPERARQVAEAMSVDRAVRPAGEAVYLHFLAVDADARRSGLGRELVAAGVEAAAQDDLPVVLETTNEENLAFYLAVGFTVLADVPLGDGPRLWVLRSEGAR